jgi:RimJ/RimL family protein N-acetyltransferase
MWSVCETAGMTNVILRAVREPDLVQLTGGDSAFGDWGPSQQLASPPSARLDEDGGCLAVEFDRDIAGYVSWHYVQWGPGIASRNPELGIWLRATHRGRGIGMAAQQQLAALFFKHTAVNRVQASTDVMNIAEQRALERAGFSREGVIRGGQWRAGAYHDLFIYSILRDEPTTTP